MKLYIALIGIFLIILLAINVDSYSRSFLAQHDASRLSGDIFYKTFGEFKDYLSYMSFIKADVYYHGGSYGFREHEEGPCETCEEDLHILGETKQAHEHEHIHEHGHITRHIRPSLNILLDIGKTTAITEHRHLSGNEEKEIVPWIYYAVRLNPHNELAYSVGGFWLAVKLKKPEEAIKFLKEGLMNNPDSWEICQTLGQVYLINKKDCQSARIYFEKAKELAEQQDIDRIDKRNIDVLLEEARRHLL